MSYRSNKTGVKVDFLLDKIDSLKDATRAESGTMSAADKFKLDTQVADEELTLEEISRLLNF